MLETIWSFYKYLIIVESFFTKNVNWVASHLSILYMRSYDNTCVQCFVYAGKDARKVRWKTSTECNNCHFLLHGRDNFDILGSILVKQLFTSFGFLTQWHGMACETIFSPVNPFSRHNGWGQKFVSRCLTIPTHQTLSESFFGVSLSTGYIYCKWTDYCIWPNVIFIIINYVLQNHWKFSQTKDVQYYWVRDQFQK